MTDIRGTLNSNRFEMDFFSGASATPAVSSDRLKRGGDIAIALLLLVFVFPLMTLITLWIALDFRGPILTVHRRSGLGGAPITILKFRTKTTQAAQADGAETLTSVGRLLKSTGLDTLPQLFNVLKGDMAMVGPMAHSEAVDRYYHSIIPQYSARTRAKPGFTGLAQVNGLGSDKCSIQGMAERVADDNAYIDYWSAGLDLKILLRAAIHTVYKPDGF